MRPEEPMTQDGSTNKQEMLGKLNIGKAVAIQQQQLEKSEKFGVGRLALGKIEDVSKPKVPGFNLPKLAAPQESAQLSLAIGNITNQHEPVPEIKRGGELPMHAF